MVDLTNSADFTEPYYVLGAVLGLRGIVTGREPVLMELIVLMEHKVNKEVNKLMDQYL